MEQPSRYEEEFQYDFYEVPCLLSVAFLLRGSSVPSCHFVDFYAPPQNGRLGRERKMVRCGGVSLPNAMSGAEPPPPET